MWPLGIKEIATVSLWATQSSENRFLIFHRMMLSEELRVTPGALLLPELVNENSTLIVRHKIFTAENRCNMRLKISWENWVLKTSFCGENVVFHERRTSKQAPTLQQRNLATVCHPLFLALRFACCLPHNNFKTSRDVE